MLQERQIKGKKKQQPRNALGYQDPCMELYEAEFWTSWKPTKVTYKHVPSSVPNLYWHFLSSLWGLHA